MEITEIGDLDEALAGLDARLGTTTVLVSGFDAELTRLRQGAAFAGREVGQLAGGISSGLRRAFDGLILDGDRLSEALKGVGLAISQSLYNVALRPVTHAIGGAIAEGMAGMAGAMLPFARGGAFSAGRVMPFARGGLITAPASFAMAGGRQGLMGEAGPEAIMPLARGADGRLGVRAEAGVGARPIQVVMHVQTPDVQGFQRSHAQIASGLSRALARGQRNR